MATDNNIKNFSAADIEKYHKGLLSVKEMHDLEKAALDDPFLADALEGYAVAGVNMTTDIADLKKRLGEKVEGSKVIPLHTERKNNFRLLKVAAMLVFVAGAAFAVYQFGFNKKADTIAQNEPVITKGNNVTDSAGSTNTTPGTAAEQKNKNLAVTPPANIEKDKPATATGTGSDKLATMDRDADGIVANDATVTSSPATTPVPLKNIDDNKTRGKAIERKIIANEEAITKNDETIKQETVGALSKDKTTERQFDDEAKKRNIAASKRSEDQNYRNQASNVFRGRVTDQNNVGVPFANVTNLEENTGTYTDARGYFNLTYPDSVLNVQVRSIGFESNNVQLRNAAPTNQVILQDDKAGLSEVVISNQKPNLLARSNNNTMQLEEPEPTDGWIYYDNYLVNNLQLPEEYKSKPVTSGEVQVSFEVNKNGEPVNFKIEKSLCSKCDKEAIRLIKEGPKWKRKAKNGRTTVTIPF